MIAGDAAIQRVKRWAYGKTARLNADDILSLLSQLEEAVKKPSRDVNTLSRISFHLNVLPPIDDEGRDDLVATVERLVSEAKA